MVGDQRLNDQTGPFALTVIVLTIIASLDRAIPADSCA
jgi:hypothetical protein